MSHAVGMCRFPDGAVYWCEYNGTVDVFKPDLFATEAEMLADWRRLGDKRCTCSGTPERVELYTLYGDGFGWIGAACRRCECITDWLSPWSWDGESEAAPLNDCRWAKDLLVAERYDVKR